MIRDGEGVAAQVLVKLGADLNRARQQVLQLLSGDQSKEPAAGSTGGRGEGTPCHPQPGPHRDGPHPMDDALDASDRRLRYHVQ